MAMTRWAPFYRFFSLVLLWRSLCTGNVAGGSADRLTPSDAAHRVTLVRNTRRCKLPRLPVHRCYFIRRGGRSRPWMFMDIFVTTAADGGR